MLLSIVIPTYNRVTYLKNLMSCIVKESSGFINEIEIVIINDGSIDDTDFYIKKQIQQNIIKINYHYQSNQGRASALKKGLEVAEGEFTVIMDDEDLFVDGGIATIISYLNKFDEFVSKGERPLAGFVFLTKTPKGKIIGTKYPKSPMFANLVSINADYKTKGDKKQVVKSSILKPVLYSVPPGERRVPTYVLWARVATSYDMCFLNEVVAIKEYLNTGLSKNINRVKMNSPKSSMLINDELLGLGSEIYKSKLYRLKIICNYHRYSMHAGNLFTYNSKVGFFYNLMGVLVGGSFYLLDKSVFNGR